MPWSIKSRLGDDTDREKGIMRKAFRGLLPDEIVFRKKSPYPKTHNPIYTEAVCNKMNAILSDDSAPVNALINRKTVRGFISDPLSMKAPFYGQLMRGPQILAYLIQMNEWLAGNNVKVDFSN
jgi:asparagine synthase (glutamine-hydrolysing)